MNSRSQNYGLSQTYSEARSLFKKCAAEAGCRIEEFPHPLKGPNGEDLAIDVAELGPPDAQSVLLIVSATHGVEGFAGSALQSRWLLEEAATRPEGVRICLVHAFNPHGFAWVRRVNEDNVDLNRNFIDWDRPPPHNDEYQRLARTIVPEGWSPQEQEQTLVELMAYLEEVGMQRLQAMVSGGQYHDPNGVFYGGAGQTWSSRWLSEWTANNLDAVTSLGVLDLHTGLGERGTAQLIGSNPPDSPAHKRATEWFGTVVPMGGADSVSASLEGDWLGKIAELAEPAQVTAVAIEYGTIDSISVLQALRADAWLHAYGNPTGPDSPAIKAQVRAAFAGDEPEWADAIWGPFKQATDQALAQLAL